MIREKFAGKMIWGKSRKYKLYNHYFEWLWDLINILMARVQLPQFTRVIVFAHSYSSSLFSCTWIYVAAIERKAQLLLLFSCLLIHMINYTNFILTYVRQATHCCSFGLEMRSLAEMLTSSSHPSWLRDSPPLSMLLLGLKKWPKRYVSAALFTNYAYHCHTAPLSWHHDFPHHHQSTLHSWSPSVLP